MLEPTTAACATSWRRLTRGESTRVVSFCRVHRSLPKPFGMVGLTWSNWWPRLSAVFAFTSIGRGAMLDWTVVFPAFLTAAVEWVEAFTIVLAVSLSIGWRAAVGAALAALGVLVAMTAATGGVLELGLDIRAIQLVVGIFLLLFGTRWLAKAVARGAGLKALRDE